MLLSRALLESAESHGPRLAVQDPLASATYSELATSAMQVAAGLRALGLQRGDRSAVVLPNGLAFVSAHLGNLFAGAISVPFDAAVTPESFAFMAANCRPRFLFSNRSGADRLQQCAVSAGIEKIICLDDSYVSSPDGLVIGRSEFLSLSPPGVFLDGISSNDVATLMYTTGTTGVAKGVQLTHENILTALRQICNFVGYSAEDREVVILPLSHNFGLGHLYCNLLNGGAVYTESGLTRVGRVLEMVDTFNATGFPGTPMGFGMLMDRFGPILSKRCARLRFTVIDSAPLPPERAVQLQQHLPTTDIMVYYGLTEASRSTFISLTREGPKYHRSVGRGLGANQIAIRRDDGTELPAGQTGEIVVRGPAITTGYWNNPDETSRLLRNGWLHTGDLGHLDGDGFLFVTGRMKDIINVGGYKVNPGEVERFIAGFPGVRDVAVAGVEGLDGATSEAVVAAIVADPTHAPDLLAIETSCCEKLERFKAPTRYLLVPAIPRTDTGKTRRAELASQLTAMLNPKKSDA